jgi:lysophospholipase L1-like esterase
MLKKPAAQRRAPHALTFWVGVLNWKRFSLFAFAATSALAAVAVWYWEGQEGESHRYARQVILFYNVSRMSDPVVVLGDSITEASSLPRSVCGHSIVNAGLNGASTASDLGGWLAPVVEGKRLAMIVVALGTNDVLTLASQGERNFADRYGKLLGELSKLAPRLAVVQIPPVEARRRMTDKMREEIMATIDRFNSVLPDVAARNNASFVTLPPADGPITIDGIHLSSEGYVAWEKAVMQAANAVCG